MPEDRAFRQLLRVIKLTEDTEIDCTTCLKRVPVYVDRELAGGNVAQEMPDLHLHLALCGDCFEEYEALRGLGSVFKAHSQSMMAARVSMPR
jgi:hypothetical protein